MAEFICKITHGGINFYLLWSSIVDDFITTGMTKSDFHEFMLDREDDDYMKFKHPGRMERVEKHGTSSLLAESVVEMASVNHCGPKGQRITIEGIIQKYIVYPLNGEVISDEELNKYLWPYED